MRSTLNYKIFKITLISILFLGGIYYLYHNFSLSWERLELMHKTLKSFHMLHPILTPLLFMGTYFLYALLPFPGIFILSLLAGYLFKQPFSTFYVTIAATLGSMLMFLLVRSTVGHVFYRHTNTKQILHGMEKGFHENAASYLLFLRLIPLFPYALVNVAGAFFRVPFKTFIWTTFVGMLPSVFVYTQAGRGLTLLWEKHTSLRASDFFNIHLTFALVGLALLSLLPILLKQLRKYKKSNPN